MLKVGHELMDLDKVVQILSGDSETTEFSLLGSESFNLSVDIKKATELLKSHTSCYELDDGTVIVLNKVAAVTLYEDETQVTFADGNQYSYEMSEEEQLLFEKALGEAVELPSTDIEKDDEDQEEEAFKTEEVFDDVEVTIRKFEKNLKGEEGSQIWEQAEKGSLEKTENFNILNESLVHKLTKNKPHSSKRDPISKKEDQGTNFLLFLGFIAAILVCVWYYASFM